MATDLLRWCADHFTWTEREKRAVVSAAARIQDGPLPLVPPKPKLTTPPTTMGGTKSICSSNSCHCAKVFIQYDFTREVFDRPKVRPGDLVSAFLWINNGAVGPCRFPTLWRSTLNGYVHMVWIGITHIKQASRIQIH